MTVRRALSAALLLLATVAAPAQGAGGDGVAGEGLKGLSSMMANERGQLQVLSPRWTSLRVAPVPVAPPKPEFPAQEVTCLAKAMYFEARGEPRAGWRAVAEVVLNRQAHEDYPDSVCGVVNDRRYGGCQFSWVCLRDDHTPRERAVYAEMQALAKRMMAGEVPEITDGATHFHSAAVRTNWGRRWPKTAVIGAHSFYRSEP